jgi:hypothetical protein
MPVILATQEAEIRRIMVQSQGKQFCEFCETLSRKTLLKKKIVAGGVAQGEGPEFKASTAKNKELQRGKARVGEKFPVEA